MSESGFFVFVVAPFCSCPASLVSRIFAVVPRCAKCFFLLRSVGRRDLSAGPEQKEKLQGVFFLLRPRRKAGAGEAPLGAGTGPEQKKNHHPGRRPTGLLLPLPFAGAGPGWCFSFCYGPAERSRRPTGRNKNKNTLHTWGRQQKFLETNDTGHEQKGATTKTKNPDSLTAALLFRGDFSGRAQLVIFFLLRPRGDAHSLTAGLGVDASRRGGVFFFCCGPAPTGVVFVFLLWPRPNAHSLTVGWGDFGKARAAFFFFFCCGPAEPGEPKTKMFGVLHRV